MRDACLPFRVLPKAQAQTRDVVERGRPFARPTGVEREDSGLIDLFAIHKRASEAPPVPEPKSTPSPAYAFDVFASTPSLPPSESTIDDPHPDALADIEIDNPFNVASRRKPVYIALGGAAVLLVFGILVAAVSGGDDAPSKAAAAVHRCGSSPAGW